MDRARRIAALTRAALRYHHLHQRRQGRFGALRMRVAESRLRRLGLDAVEHLGLGSDPDLHQAIETVLAAVYQLPTGTAPAAVAHRTPWSAVASNPATTNNGNSASAHEHSDVERSEATPERSTSPAAPRFAPEARCARNHADSSPASQASDKSPAGRAPDEETAYQWFVEALDSGSRPTGRQVAIWLGITSEGTGRNRRAAWESRYREERAGRPLAAVH